MTVVQFDGHVTRPRTLTAAALNLADGVQSKALIDALRKHQAWQLDAAGYVSEIGEIHYVVNRAASALSEARLYAGTVDPASGQVVPVDAPESTVTPAVADIAQAVLAEFRSPVGGQKQLIHQAYVNAEVPGEFYVVDDSDDADPEPSWWIRSVLETKVGDPGQPVDIKGVGKVPFEAVSRVWRPHPMRFEQADSGMRPVLGACELVLLIDRHFRAAMRSRLFAGLLLMPSGLRQGEPDKAQKGEAKSDPFVDDFVTALAEGIGEEGAASAVTPNFLWGDPDDLKEVRRVEFAQRIDPDTLALRESSITRIVQGLEYPPEIVTGTGDASHWGAWFIGDSFIDHIRPKGNFLAEAFTQVVLRPGMEAASVDPAVAAQVVLAFDYSPLARKPNIVETAQAAHDRYVISDESLRRDLGYDDDDAPSPEEVAERVARRQQVRGGVGGVTTGPPSEGPEAVAASALSNTLGGRLARLDLELVERLVGATVTALRRATERAGNRAKSRVASAHRDAVRNVPAGDVCAHLGPTLLAAAGLTEDELLADALADLERDYRRWALAAGTAAFGLAEADGNDEARARMDANVDSSWEWLQAALLVSLTASLARGGDPSEAEIRGLIRQAVARAGGVTELAAVTDAAVRVPVSTVTGIGTGPLTMELLAAAGYEVPGWRWVHDSPEHPFPPHEALDGAEATTPEEFGISFDGWPGDHHGCLCTLEPLVRRAE